MEKSGQEVHLDQTEARSGSTPNVVRYILIISLVLAILALSVIWITGALTSESDTGAAAANGQMIDAEPEPQAG